MDTRSAERQSKQEICDAPFIALLQGEQHSFKQSQKEF